MNRPTRQEQARAILERRSHRIAAEILDRRPNSAADYAEAFNLEWVDLISEIPGPEALLALGHTRVGPRDGLYILDDGDSYRVYVQERGIETHAISGVGFDEARDAVIEHLIMLQGLPFRPPG
jgi:hypothetical protein